MILKQGSKGPAVEHLQQKLKAVGYDPGQVDGSYGSRTAAAVRAFQEGCPDLAPDGIAGPITRAALMADHAALRKIARLTFPTHTGDSISIEVANRIDRHVVDEAAHYIDWLVDLTNIEEEGPNRNSVGRDVLPISTGVPILPGQSVQLTAHVDSPEFRCQRFMIPNAGTPGGAADWVVNDIRINNRAQLPGDVPGALFSANAPDPGVVFEPIMQAIAVVVIVTYIGTIETGAPFFAAMSGMKNDYSPHYRRVYPPVANRLPHEEVMRTEIPPGFAYVSWRERRETGDISITIFVPSIDQATMDVAVDSTLAAGESTQAVQTMIEHALDVRGDLVRDTYIALVAQRASALAADEAEVR